MDGRVFTQLNNFFKLVDDIPRIYAYGPHMIVKGVDQYWFTITERNILLKDDNTL